MTVLLNSPLSCFVRNCIPSFLGIQVHRCKQAETPLYFVLEDELKLILNQKNVILIYFITDCSAVYVSVIKKFMCL